MNAPLQSDESGTLETAIEAARAAGQILVERLSEEREIRVKGRRDVVTDADLAAEAAIVDLIRARFPDHVLLTEEGTHDVREAPYLWVVDPLDGTTNYSRRFPIFSTSIGLVERGQFTVGVVYDPLREHTFAAQRGRGAMLNGERLDVSSSETVDKSLVGVDWAHAQGDRQEVVARVAQVAPTCRTMRGIGSAALGLCYVAAGWLDAYFNLSLKPWDLAAGLLLIQEAGGRISDIEGRPWQPWGERVLVSNGRVHDELLTLMEQR